MATTLQSPGLSITVTDESQYISPGPGTTPLVLLATSRNKTNPAGLIASGTTDANAGKLQIFTSQRDLISGLGYPIFRTSSGSSLHGDERNEYGLQTAYSALSLGSQAYVIRADIDLEQLTATSVRPTGTVSDGFMWLDLANTQFGVFEWNAQTQSYKARTPMMITGSGDVGTDSVNTPKDIIGQVGTYAAVVYNSNNPLFYRNENSTNSWVALGTAEWQKSWATVTSTYATYAGNEVPHNTALTINGVAITLVATDSTTCTGADVVGSINGAFASNYGDGIAAEIPAAGKANAGRLILRATSAAKSNGSTADGKVTIASGAGALALGLTPKTYYAPMLKFGTYTEVPTFATGESTPAPTGSIWIKTTSIGGGASWAVKRYNSSTSSFAALSAPIYGSNQGAMYGLDPLNGGLGLADGAVYVQYSTMSGYPATFKVMERMGSGVTKVTPSSAPAGTFTIGQTFSLTVSQPGQASMDTFSFTISGTTTDDFINLVLAKNIANVYAVKESNGAISFVHRAGGDILLTDTTAGPGNPIAAAGYSTNTTGVYYEASGTYVGALRASKWAPLLGSLTYSTETPYVAPENGTLWYYSNAYEADVMICGLDGWKGYRTVTHDARGYDLSLTDPLGPIFTATKPTLQSTGNAVARGDLWVDTSDMENFPVMRRYNGTSWELIDNTDHITQNGVLFADARWDASVNNSSQSVGGIVDPISGDLPAISGMLLSNYIDLDCPDYRGYPRGTILWNTRRNGMNVKQFVSNKFNSTAYPNASVNPAVHTVGYIPTYTSTWSNASGKDSTGMPYHGHKAQRQMVVKALKAAIDSNSTVREEQYQFNLIVCPGYPELIPNMVALNTDRNETAFIIGDTPLSLGTSVTDITAWSNNNETTGSKMLAVYYPAGLSSDINGNDIAVPASHMALRTYIHNDNISYQWFAPAGTRRGLVDNATAVGYVDYNTGTFVKVGVGQGLRDSLYNQRINPIANLPGSGITIFGQRTRDPISEGSNRVNVSRLVNYIRASLTSISNSFLFEPNDKSTRDQIKGIIESAMNDLVAKRGIYDYLVVCDNTNNPSSLIARNELHVDIAIEPMKDVEFIYIPIRLKNPGDIAKLGK
jgi:hypothetical protein